MAEPTSCCVEPGGYCARVDTLCNINRGLETKARALVGLKGYITNLEAPTPEFVMGAYHQTWQIEKSFRMSKSDLRARPIYHHKRDSIEAHSPSFRRPRRHPRARVTNRMVHQETHHRAASLPHHRHPSRRPDRHSRRPVPDDIRAVLDRLHGRQQPPLIDQSQENPANYRLRIILAARKLTHPNLRCPISAWAISSAKRM
jgi:hypothetical protein